MEKVLPPDAKTGSAPQTLEQMPTKQPVDKNLKTNAPRPSKNLPLDDKGNGMQPMRQEVSPIKTAEPNSKTNAPYVDRHVRGRMALRTIAPVASFGTTHPTFVQNRHPKTTSAAEQYAHVCSELDKLRKEIYQMRLGTQNATAMDKKTTSSLSALAKVVKPVPEPMPWFCTYDMGKVPGAVEHDTNGQHKMLPASDLLILVKKDPLHAMAGLVALHRCSLQMHEQGKNTETVLYAGLLHFGTELGAQQQIADSMKTSMSMDELCEKHCELKNAREAAFVLCRAVVTKGFAPLCWCTGADGFCVAWQDVACFMRYKKQKVEVLGRCVDIMMKAYLEPSVFAAIDQKFVFHRGVLNCEHAALCQDQCWTAAPLKPMPPTLMTKENLYQKLVLFWIFLLTSLPPTRKSIQRLPLVPVPGAPAAEVDNI